MSGFIAWVAHSGVVQGVIIGGALAFFTATLVLTVVARSVTTTVDGWKSIRACGRPGNGVLVRAASARALPLVNVFEEAAYWTTTKDSLGRALSGSRAYVLRFPPGQLPPNDAFWSLTLTDPVGYMVRSSIDRSSLDDLSDLAANTDGSIDIYLQHEPPAGHERNWLPAPPGGFKLMLRAYLPAAAVLDGTYRVPPVVEVK